MLGLRVLGGAFVGLLSGLLGVGGAVIIMPLLNVFFDRLGFSVEMCIRDRDRYTTSNTPGSKARLRRASAVPWAAITQR